MSITALSQMQASQSLNSTKSSISSTLADVAFLPMRIITLPISMAGELLFSKNSEAPKHEEEPVQENASQQPAVTLGQVAQPADISGAIQAAVAALPEHSDNPVYINLNVNTQQAAATAVSSRPHGSFLKRTKNSFTRGYASLTSWIKNNKLRFITGCATTSYLGVQGYLWYHAQKLSEDTSWSTWHKHCSLSDFYQMDHQELVTSLFNDLEKKYQHKDQIQNAHQFLKETSHELRSLAHYKRAATATYLWPLNKFFFIDTSLLESIPDRIQRVTFLHDTVHGWLTHNTKPH